MKALIAALAVVLAVAAPAFRAQAADQAPAVAVPAVAVAAAPQKSETAPGEPAMLTVFNRPILLLRHSLFGVPPSERADAARVRINRILEGGGPAKIAVHSIGLGQTVTIDGSLAYTVLHGDVAAIGGETLDTVTHASTIALQRVIEETREFRDGRFMLLATVHALIATVLCALTLYALLRIGRVVMRKALRTAQAASKRLRVGGGALVDRRHAVQAVYYLLRAAGWALVLLVTYEWLSFVLGRFPYTRAWSEQLHGFLFDTFTGMLSAVAHATPGLLIAVIVFVIARALDRAQKAFFDRVRSGRLRVNWVDKDTAPPTRRLLTLAIWVFAVVMAYPYIPGSSTDAFKGLSVLLGLMISVGAAGIVGQAASGLILMYTRTFRPGEYVRIGEAEGTVVRMGMFTTQLRTGMGEELSLPNSTVLGSTTRNLSRPAIGSGFMVSVDTTIGYDVPWRQVESILVSASRATPGVLASPPPRVYVHALSDFYVEYRLVCQVTSVDPQLRAATMSTLHTVILDAFNEHGVQIMSPHYLGDPQDAKVVPPADWYRSPATPPAPKPGA